MLMFSNNNKHYAMNIAIFTSFLQSKLIFSSPVNRSIDSIHVLMVSNFIVSMLVEFVVVILVSLTDNV